MVDFNRIAGMMSGDLHIDSSNNSGLNKDSSNIEILDYMMVQLCKLLDTRKMAFKGGYVLKKILPEEIQRYTYDIDFSIQLSEYYDSVKSALMKIGEFLVSGGVIDSYEIKETITETSSGGIKFIRGADKKNLGVDVGLHNIEHGTIPMSVFGIDVSRFTVERMLSDKMSAIFSRKRFRRTKDLYDFYTITNCFNVNMHDLVQEVVIRDRIDWEATPFRNEVKVQYKQAYEKLDISEDGTSNQLNIKPEFDVVLNRVLVFYNNWNEDLLWDCRDRSFRRC